MSERTLQDALDHAELCRGGTAYVNLRFPEDLVLLADEIGRLRALSYQAYLRAFGMKSEVKAKAQYSTSGRPVTMGRTLENALAHAKVICGIRGCDNIAEEDLVALAAEIKRLQDREAQIKPIFLRYEEIAEPFAEAAKVGESRVEALAKGIAELRAEIERLQEEARCAGCGGSPAFCNFCKRINEMS